MGHKASAGLPTRSELTNKMLLSALTILSRGPELKLLISINAILDRGKN
jgi:hypothetical protein